MIAVLALLAGPFLVLIALALWWMTSPVVRALGHKLHGLRQLVVRRRAPHAA